MLVNPTLAAAALSFVLGGALAADTIHFRAAGLYECPELCSVTGPNPSNWTRFVSNNDLNWCKNSTMLLSLPVHMPLSSDTTDSVFHACLSSRGGEVRNRVRDLQKREAEGIHIRSEVGFLQSSAKTKLPNFANDASTAIKELQAKYLDVHHTDTNQTVYFAKHGDSTVGVYVGGDVQKQGIAATLIQKLDDYVASGSDLAQTSLFQLCGEGRNADSVAGVVADGRGGLESVFAVQDFVKTWAESQCVTDVDVDGSRKTETVHIAYVRTDALPGQDGAQRRWASSPTAHHGGTAVQLGRRGDCKVVQAVSGDSCSTLASKCHLSPADFTKLHSDSKFCSSITAGQWVCCTSGPLPDMRPKKNLDGSCHSYTALEGDSCAKIAAANGIKADDIEDLNKNTWGFAGCNSLFPAMHICLSPGAAPMPAPVANAKCGPQVPGTKKPLFSLALPALNPCPLKACCNVWGQCGTTEGFCIEASLGPPGTSKPGKNGCISNCGMDIVNNKVGPDQQISLGYFEAWNFNRSCLHMDVTQMSKSITHIHFAFVDVTAGFAVSTAQVQEQWDKFKGMKGHHKVAVFGGWAASTEPTSYWIFREGVKPENREKLATNLANFIIANNMDGIDLDWEYPGAQDIPGVPAASPFDGQAYVKLLELLRQKLGKDKSISIAAPASYWYLQNFPIEDISKIVDYIVFMTYDLHGQWDYGAKWSLPGCGGESCLRSHINMTETLNALSMITKAGVPSNKIVVGVASYGRSFQMTKAGCTGPQCGFTGPESSAKKGRCTNTNGYISNAEIEEIIGSVKMNGSPNTPKRDNSGIHTFTDDSETQILVYDDTNWVAYMDDDNKERRKAKWKGLNFAGTTDWAVDLATFTPGDNNKQCWLSKHCQSLGADDTKSELPSQWRWDQLCTDDAWNAAMDYYRKNKASDKQSYPRMISNFFHGPPNMDCDVLAGENGCHDFRNCIQGNGTGPAATFILNGFVSMSNTFLNLYEGVQDGQQSLEVNGVLAKFVNTFAPEPKEAISLKIILDIVSFGLSALTGPYFNNFLRNTPWGAAHRDSSDNIKDTLRAVITFSFGTAKDAMEPKPASDADMSGQLAVIVRHFKTALTKMSEQAFSGSDDGISMLQKVIGGGKLLDARPTGKLGLEDRMMKIFYAMLIPYLWRQKGWSPVLVDTDSNCDSTDAVDHLPDENSKVCVDGKRYYLIRPGDNGAMDCSQRSDHWSEKCVLSNVENMNGFAQLNGVAWAGLRKEDLAGSIVSRRKVGWSNPLVAASWPDFSDSDHFDKMWDWLNNDNMIQSPGLIDIPMCGMDEVMDNWRLTKNDYYSWPCNKTGVPSFSPPKNGGPTGHAPPGLGAGPLWGP